MQMFYKYTSPFIQEPIRKEKHIKAIDVMQLLADLNEMKPNCLADVNRIVLSQKQHDMIIFERK